MLQCSGDFAEMPAMLLNLVLKNILHENTYKIICVRTTRARGGVVVKALCYKPAGHGFNSRWCHWNFSVT